MPAIVQDPGILKAARDAIEVMLTFKGIQVTLTPQKGTPIQKPGGGHDFNPPAPRDPQLMSVAKSSFFDGVEFSNNDDGLNRKRAYTVTARHDADIEIGDTWSDDEADYEVMTVDNSSGYKTIATVTGWLKVD